MNGTGMNAPYQECPRFGKCNVNRCPLSPLYPVLYTDLEDRQIKCTLEKQVRYRIGSKHPEVLKYQGLTVKEWTGKQRFGNLPEAERKIIRERAKGLFLASCQRQPIEKGTDVSPIAQHSAESGAQSTAEGGT